MAFRSFSPVLKCAGAAASAIMLQACATTQNTQADASAAGQKDYREAVGVYSNPAADEGMDPVAAAAFWGTRYNRNQSDPAVAVSFSRALRKIGSTDEAVSVMQTAQTKNADNADVSLEYGKVLVESGRAFEAIRHLETAVTKMPTDWSALSAYGVALDQIDEHEEARKYYDRALSIAPGAVSVLNNKGLSYALQGQLSMARTTLKAAAGRAGGDARIRQNLALVMALSGDLQSAERLARSDLPPQVADNNIGYYRQLMNQPAYWEEYAATSVDTPEFDAAPAAPLKSEPNPPLREEPKEEEAPRSEGEPIALIEAAPVTRASMPEIAEETPQE